MPKVEVAKVFVAMPFSEDLWPVWQTIDQAARKTNMQAIRVDHLPQVENIHDAIWREIEGSDALLADLTGQNANVAMEVHHARLHRKPLVLITQSPSDLPFDLRVMRAIVYENTEPGRAILEERIADSLRGATRRPDRTNIVEAGVELVEQASGACVEGGQRVVEALASTLPGRRPDPYVLNRIRQGISLAIAESDFPPEVTIPHRTEPDGQGGKVLVLEIRVRDRLYALANAWEAAHWGGPPDTLRMILWLTPEHLIVPFPPANIRQIVAEVTTWSPVFAPPADSGPQEFDVDWFEGDDNGVLGIETVRLDQDAGVAGPTRCLADLLRGGVSLALRLAEPCRAPERVLEGLRAAAEELRQRPILPGQSVTPKSDVGRWNFWHYLSMEAPMAATFWVALDPVDRRLVYGADAGATKVAREIARELGGSSSWPRRSSERTSRTFEI